MPGLFALDDRSPQLPPAGTYWIAPGAVVVGDVRLGAEASVWFHAVLRGDSERLDIGARTNIQDGAMVHTDVGVPLSVGADCTIGHHAILHGCTIGDTTLIGMGATILNGARIGANCIVGANALVTEGKVFEDYSLIVGSPARVVRTLDASAAERIKASAAHYVANWRRFVAGLRPLA